MPQSGLSKQFFMTEMGMRTEGGAIQDLFIFPRRAERSSGAPVKGDICDHDQNP